MHVNSIMFLVGVSKHIGLIQCVCIRKNNREKFLLAILLLIPNICGYCTLFQLTFFTRTEYIIQLFHQVVNNRLLQITTFQIVHMKLYCQLFAVNHLVKYTRVIRVLFIAPLIQLTTQFLVEKYCS